ncbi:hypothetical protein G195_002965 [Phytophthora kernoviae 00238/432]|uniref:ABC transporter domain-containing protein n=2 Tax=Phytophthora kernoviae TaxID=325452 RepID=A0A8T0M158_9STRA|nr:hypothetical protein G195_002965 [Phytophthora kernoviae 00238/432]KAG2526285.1 hypothetical protein JM16_002073 [Phytophthora kernoviae]
MVGVQEAPVGYNSGQEMMARGPYALHEDVSTKVETALGRTMAQMEVYFKHVSLAADLVVVHDPRHRGRNDHEADDWRDELPTLPNHVMKKVAVVSVKKHSVRKHILQDITGSFRPGTVTLVLGQSGAGKSALMKLLSGRFPMKKEISVEGEMMYSGISRDKILNRLPQFVNYVNQSDTHMPTMTIRETFEFAHECCGPHFDKHTAQLLSRGSPAENTSALQAASSVFEHYPDIVLQTLGLEDCQHTIVGNAMHRGISGGEKKRVTTGEMEFGMKYVTLMDEITTGLDSAAAYDIIAAQRSMALRFHKAVVISLLQPSPEVFSLFDNVLLLNEGRVLYHGPTSQVQSYFESLGFICPPRRDIADFLCDLATPQQIQYQRGQPPQGHSNHPMLASEFADLWVHSSIYQLIGNQANARAAKLRDSADTANFMRPVREFHQNFWASTWTLMKRQFILIKRNHAFLVGRAMLVIIMGFIFASLFYQMNMADTQVTMGVIFAAMLFLGLGQAAMLSTFYDSRNVFYKQRTANFYRTSSYVLASSISQIPLALLESIVFGSLVYWAGGFVNEAGAFLLFELFLMLVILVFLALFFFLVAATPNLSIAKPVAMVCLMIFILFGGFVVAKNTIPDWLIWLYWLDPVAWTVRSAVVSQYRSNELDVCVYESVDYCTAYNMTMGNYALSLFDVPSEKSWVWYGVVFMVAAYVFFMMLSYFALEYHRYERPEHIDLPHEEKKTTTTADEGVYSSYAERKVEPVSVAFKDLWYTVQAPAGPGQPAQSLDLLKGITGFALPGKITALMGSTGAGKTTLMDVIAGRKTEGTIKGKILLNGYEASDLSVRRCTGYCEQNDIHSTGSTFREAITFSAFLRQGADVPDSRKFDSVDECLELLGLEDIADQMIRGSSMEKMKRLTIGVEMAAQPSVLFLDEPTSGLDARFAKVIMDGVRKVADSGRTVLCTIHQPSMDVFHLFDSLLLLKRGGETVYFGDLGHECSTLINYFEAVPSVQRIPDGYNPATWMLAVIGAGVASQRQPEVQENDGQQALDFVKYFNASAYKQLLDDRMMEPGLFLPSEEFKPVSYTKKRAATSATQLRFLLGRFFTMYWRTPSYNLTRLFISVFLGLVVGLVYISAEFKTYQGINSGLGMVFISTVFIGMVSFISILPMAFEERAAFYRERASQTYSALWYFVSFTLVELPYVFVGASLFTIIYYPMVGLQGFVDGVVYCINVAFMILFQAYMGQLLVFALPSIEVAAIIGILFNAICLLVMGFNPPEVQIPHGYKWLYAIVPLRYSFSALAAIAFGKCSNEQLQNIMMTSASPDGLASLDMSDYPHGCQIVQNAPATIGEVPVQTYVEHIFGIKHAHIAQYFGTMVGMIVFFRILTALAMRYINHQQR